MTDQELFDKVAGHLLKQAERSVDGNKGCLYRGPRGLMCAIGCLIPDERYTSDLEQFMPDDRPLLEAAGLGEEQAKLAYKLQEIHDGYDAFSWPRKLREFATEYGLDPSIVDQLEPAFRAKLMLTADEVARLEAKETAT